MAPLPSPTVTWARVDRRPLAPNVEQLPGGVIRITRVAGPEHGEYRCTAENVAGRAEAVAALTVHRVPEIEMSPRGSVTLRLGAALSISCLVTGDPAPSLAWARIGRTRTELGTFSPRLEVSSVTKEDEGTYACVATNTAGQAEERVQVTMTQQCVDIFNVNVL